MYTYMYTCMYTYMYTYMYVIYVISQKSTGESCWLYISPRNRSPGARRQASPVQGKGHGGRAAPEPRQAMALEMVGIIGKMMGKWWENDGKMMGKWWDNDGKMMSNQWLNGCFQRENDESWMRYSMFRTQRSIQEAITGLQSPGITGVSPESDPSQCPTLCHPRGKSLVDSLASWQASSTAWRYLR